MCGRFALVEGPRDLGRLYAVLAKMEDFPPRYNIAPTQPVLAVWQETGRRVARLVRWGLVPGWVKDPREFPLLINARAETMTEKPAFRDSVRNQRCVVPVSGYYEWRTGPGGSKVPYYIARADGEPMSLAGLLSSWAGPNGEEVDTVALVTTAANDALSAIHHRMPRFSKANRSRTGSIPPVSRPAARANWPGLWARGVSFSIRSRTGSIRAATMDRN